MSEKLVRIATLCLVFAFFMSLTRFSVGSSENVAKIADEQRQAYSCIVVRGDKIEVIYI